MLPFAVPVLGRRYRKFARYLRAILRRGNIEPVLFLLIMNLALSGVTLCAAHSTPVLTFPKLFGFAYLVLASIGALGLFGRDHRLKVVFGFLGFFLRVWMAARFFLSDWQDVAWCSYALGALCFSWIGARSACRYVWIETRRQKVEE